MALNVNQVLQQGIAAHKQGNLQEAARLYRSILQIEPAHADANHNLGLIEVSTNNVGTALPFFKVALDANSSIEQFWVSYIDALIRKSQFKDAKRVLKKAKKKGFSGDNLSSLKVALTAQERSRRQSTPSQIPPQAKIDKLFASYQSGQHQEARDLGLAITQKFPNHQLAWKILGAIFVQLGQMDEALSANQKAVKIDPHDVEAHNEMAVTLQDLGRLEEAEASYKQAITLKPDYAEAHYNLSIALQKLGRFDEAEASCRQVIRLKPEFVEGYSNLGNSLKELGRLEEAETSYRTAIVLKPDYPEAHYNLSITLNELGRIEEAEATCRQVIALQPGHIEARYNLGAYLQELGRFEEAEASYRHTLELFPDYADAHNNLGNTLKELGRLEEAESAYRKAVVLKLDYPEAHCNLGVALQELGRPDEAKASYSKALVQKPDYAEAHRGLCLLKQFNAEDEQFLQMQRLHGKRALNDDEHCHICFALGKASQDLNQLDRSFNYYSEGNTLRKALLAYEIQQDVDLFEQVKRSHPAIDKHSFKPDGLLVEPRPIFILGMPRSGTTLVEQIVTSHSAVTGAGELGEVEIFGDAIARGDTQADSETLMNFRTNYLESLKKVSTGHQSITDKMPLNFRYISLILSALPEAKIVHVRRNPAATCWGNYQQYFTTKSLGYSYDLNDLVAYYGMYQDLMRFWNERYGEQIYNLDYESLVTHQQEETRRLIKYLDLQWEDACLAPEDNKRNVRTASNIQIRQKVYGGSSQEWKKFKPFLNGALDHLGN